MALTDAYYFIGTGTGIYTKIYDGKKLQAEQVTSDGYLPTDDLSTPISTNSICHVAQYVGLEAEESGIYTYEYDETLGKYVGSLELRCDEGFPKVSRDGEDVTDQYNQTQVANGEMDTEEHFIDTTPGCKTFTIISRDITLESGSGTWEYDGTAHSNTNVSDTTSGKENQGYVSGEEFTYSNFASVTFVTDTPVENTFSYSDSKTALTSDYNVTTKYGQLKITQRTVPVTITVEDQEWTYDGTTSSFNTSAYTVDGELAYGDTITVTLSCGSNVDAGTYEDGIIATYKIVHSDGTDVTDMYANVTVDKGDLTINKRDVILTSASDSKKYDGTPLTNVTVTESGSGFVKDEGATYDVTGSQTVIGSSNNCFTYNLKENTSTKNYNIETVEGTLTVTGWDQLVTITADSATKMYDGTELTKKTVTVTGLAEGHTVEAQTVGEIIHVGTAANEIKNDYVIKDANDNDVTAAYTNKQTVDGTLTVTQRDVTLTSDSATKMYDGTPLTKETVTVSGSGFISGEGAQYYEFASRTAVGSIDNTYSYVMQNGTSESDYAVTRKYGTLTVTPNDTLITITADSNSKMYDGSVLTDTGYSVDTSLLAEGDYFASVTVTGTITDAGTAANEVTGWVIKNQAGDDVTSFYSNVQTVNGTLEVTKRDVTLTSGSATKLHDGSPLTNDTVTVSGDDGFVGNEGATYRVTGSQTEIGSSANTFEYTLNEGTKAENYNITKVEGTLTVTGWEQLVIITADSNEQMYNGTTLTDSGYTVTGLAAGHTATVTVSGEITHYGTADNVVTEYTIYDEKGVDVTAAYTNVQTVKGTLEVTRRSITLVSGDASKAYDGTELTNSTVTMTGDGFIDGEGYTVEVTGSQTEVGSSANAFEYTLNEGTKAENYDITKVEGGLIVTEAKAEEKEPEFNPSTGETSLVIDETQTTEVVSYNVVGKDATVQSNSDKAVTVSRVVATAGTATVEAAGDGAVTVLNVDGKNVDIIHHGSSVMEITQSVTADDSLLIQNDGGDGELNLSAEISAGALNIVNDVEKIINGGYGESGEKAANVTVKGSEDVTISNDGHINMNLTAASSYLKIVNTSADTLTGSYEAENVDLANVSGGAVRNATVTAADTITISGVGSIENSSLTAANITISADAVQTVDANTLFTVTGTWSNQGTINVTVADEAEGKRYQIVKGTAADWGKFTLTGVNQAFALEKTAEGVFVSRTPDAAPVIDGTTMIVTEDKAFNSITIRNEGALIVKDSTVAAEKLFAAGTGSTISGETIAVGTVIVAEGADLAVDKDQYDSFIASAEFGDANKGTLKVTAVSGNALRTNDVDTLMAKANLNSVEFVDQDLIDVNKLNVKSTKAATIAFRDAYGTKESDTVRFYKDTDVTMGAAGRAIDLEEGSNKIQIDQNAKTTILSDLTNVSTLKAAAASTVEMADITFQLGRNATLKAEGTFKAGTITGTDKKTTLTIGKSAAFTADAIALGEKSDKLSVGKSASFTATGNVVSADTISLGAYSSSVFAGIDGTKKLSISNGKSGQSATLKASAVTGTAANDSFSFGNYNDVDLTGLDFGAGNDTLKIGNYADADVTGALTFGEGTDKLTIGKGASLTVSSLDVDSLEKLSMSKDAMLYLGTDAQVKAAQAKWSKYSSQIAVAQIA